jgi:large subunit ribosomal protein L30
MAASTTYFKITLRRSTIGLPTRFSGVLNALGLRKRMAVVFHPVSQDVAGQIMRVKELVAVEEVDKAYTKAEMKDMRRPEPGYYVERKYGQDIWNQSS